MIRTLAPLFLAASALAGGSPTHSALTYAVVGGRELKLDLYLPSTVGVQHPCVVWIHGGAWMGGSRHPIPARVHALVDAGIAVASVDYRLLLEAGQYGNEPVTFPAQIHDVKGSVRWLRAHAGQYGIDSLRIGAFGPSAGGHLAALLATSSNVAPLEGVTGGNLAFSSAVQIAAAHAATTDLLHVNEDVTFPPGSSFDHDAPESPESRLIGFDGPGQGIGVLRANLSNPAAPFPALASLALAASPITWVGAGDPPILLMHGDLDDLIPWKQSRRLADALRAANTPVRFHLQPGGTHGAFGGVVDSAVTEFFVQRFFGALAPVTTCSTHAPASACPCGNAGFFGHGCANSQATSIGALLQASGGTSADSYVLTALGAPPNSPCIFLQGSASIPSPSYDADGLRCVGGALVRLAMKSASAGAAQFPAVGEPSIRARSAALGAPIPAGGTRHYQVYYRDVSTSFCVRPVGGLSNLSNGVRIAWP